MRKLTLLATICLPLLTHAQSWEIGATAGAANYLGDLVRPATFTFQETNLYGGLFLRRNVDEHWSLRLGANYARLSGDDLNFIEEADRRGRNFSFKTNLFEGNGLIEYSPFPRLNSAGEARKVLPYFFAGLGLAYTKPDVNFNEGSTTVDAATIARDRADVKNIAVAFPFGAGFRFPIGDKHQVGIEAGMRPVQSDYIDGISQTANPNKNDWYILGGLTYSYRLGSNAKDSDGDGVPDKKDQCPDVPGVSANKGCPAVSDSDGDGIPNDKDRCPYAAGPATSNGCPEMPQAEQEAIAVAVKNINFETSSAVLTKESLPILDSVALVLKRYNYYTASIEGHTDNVGDDQFNLKLSKDRAKACYDYLMKKGVAAKQMRYEGYGETRPLAGNDTEEGRRQNRRVAFRLSIN
jgi:outer membrane protein OmpA-like peptidoglycan-associated protein